MKENKKALDEINKGASMGIEAIDLVYDKVEDDDLKKVLREQKDEYNETLEKIEKIYDEYSCKDELPSEPSAINKAMTWWGIEMKTFADTSSSKISELLLQGTNMGIVEGKKILNNKDLDSKVKIIIEEFVSMQEESVETLKKYL